MSQSKYQEYDLHSGSLSYWRRTAKWPVAGKDSASVWATIPLFLLFCIFFGGAAAILWTLFYIKVVIFIMCKFLKMNVSQLFRYVLQRAGITHKRGTAYWKMKQLSVALIVALTIPLLIVPTSSEAAFEIIVPTKNIPLDSFASSGEIYIDGGFGRNVKMIDLLRQILPSPYDAEFFNSEIQDMKINWYAEDKVFLNSVLADISRRYGLLFKWKPSSGVIYVSWENGQCKKAIKEDEALRSSEAERMDTFLQKRPTFIRKITNEITQEEIIC
jgi:hypothetical protein